MVWVPVVILESQFTATTSESSSSEQKNNRPTSVLVGLFLGLGVFLGRLNYPKNQPGSQRWATEGPTKTLRKKRVKPLFVGGVQAMCFRLLYLWTTQCTLGSMCGMFIYIWVKYIVNISEYIIHGFYGIYSIWEYLSTPIGIFESSGYIYGKWTCKNNSYGNPMHFALAMRPGAPSSRGTVDGSEIRKCISLVNI